MWLGKENSWTNPSNTDQLFFTINAAGTTALFPSKEEAARKQKMVLRMEPINGFNLLFNWNLHPYNARRGTKQSIRFKLRNGHVEAVHSHCRWCNCCQGSGFYGPNRVVPCSCMLVLSLSATVHWKVASMMGSLNKEKNKTT